jgi:hypothetical protein
MDAIKKWNSRLEKIWLVIAIISTVFAVIISIFDNFEGVEVYFLLSLMAWGIFLIRRGLRKKLSKKK